MAVMAKRSITTTITLHKLNMKKPAIKQLAFSLMAIFGVVYFSIDLAVALAPKRITFNC